MNETLKEMKEKLHTVTDLDFKRWYDKYRIQVRKNAGLNIDWPFEEMILFHQISHLQLICKTVRHAMLSSENFKPAFVEFFDEKKLNAMCQDANRIETPENVAVNLH